MAYVNEQLNKVKADLYNSWYFRVWLVAWLVCGSVTFASLIMFSDYNTFIDPSSALSVTINNATYLNFPVFQFRFGTVATSNRLEKVNCKHNGMTLQSTECGGTATTANCRQLLSGGEVAQNIFNIDPLDRQIVCTVEVIVDTSAKPTVLTWEMDEIYSIGGGYAWYGPDEMRIMEVNPNTKAVVHVTKSVKMKDGDSQTDLTTWEPFLTYEGLMETNTSYTVIVEIQTFKVMTYNEVSRKNIVDWENCAWIGGFGLFMYMIHWMFMAIVGMVVENNSQYLNTDKPVAYDEYGSGGATTAGIKASANNQDYQGATSADL
jgi:hypothetical protein